ncbi:MAG: DNA repair exonuclease [Oscillospiraceae bacterium]|jgi:DNA repair exonuclease SbcCD nuclease subunit|nr:DNA repair exonuclease [Oscillospiraceae bacterium]
MKELKLLHAADLHLDSAFEALSPEAAEERRAEQRELLFRIEDLAEKRGVAAVLLSGDIFDNETVRSETARDFNSSLGALSCPVIIAPGNHDPYTPHSMWETMRIPENVYIFKSAGISAAEFQGIPARFWGAAFTNSFSHPLLNGFSRGEKTDELADVLVIHGDTAAGAGDYNPISREALVKCGMDYAALGHIHARTPLMTAGGTAYAYPGCTEGRGFDETGEKGLLIVTLSDAGVRTEFVPLGGVRYEILRVDVGGKDVSAAVCEAVSGLTENDCCRLVLAGECSAQPDLGLVRKALEGRFRELQLRDETTPKRELWPLRNKDTLSGVLLDKLYTIYTAADNDAERRRAELAARYGLAAVENGGEPL